MPRQCQRPDCAEPAAVAYHFDAAKQMVVIDQLHGSLDAEAGALCARHGATMVLPRGWWLDDRRQAVPTLFAAIKAQRAEQASTRRRRVVLPPRSPEPRIVVTPQLEPVHVDTPTSGSEPEALPVPVPVREPMPEVVATRDSIGTNAALGEPEHQPLWRPEFDADDDLSGLLNASSPLLSRAFSGRNTRPPKSGS